MRTLFLATLLCLSPLASAYELPDRPYSLRVHDAGIRDVLEDLFHEAGIKFDIDPAIGNDALMSFNTGTESWSRIFLSVLRKAHLTYGFDRSGNILVMRE